MRSFAPRSGGWCCRGQLGGRGRTRRTGRKARERGGGGGFRVTGDLLFLTEEEAEAYHREALKESNGDNGDDEECGGDRDHDKGEGDDEGFGKGGEKEGTRGGG